VNWLHPGQEISGANLEDAIDCVRCVCVFMLVRLDIESNLFLPHVLVDKVFTFGLDTDPLSGAHPVNLG
jgi:hypothetical protein